MYIDNKDLMPKHLLSLRSPTKKYWYAKMFRSVSLSSLIPFLIIVLIAMQRPENDVPMIMQSSWLVNEVIKSINSNGQYINALIKKIFNQPFYQFRLF